MVPSTYSHSKGTVLPFKNLNFCPNSLDIFTAQTVLWRNSSKLINSSDCSLLLTTWSLCMFACSTPLPVLLNKELNKADHRYLHYLPWKFNWMNSNAYETLWIGCVFISSRRLTLITNIYKSMVSHKKSAWMGSKH